MNNVLYEDEQDGINNGRDELCLRATYVYDDGRYQVGFMYETELQVKVTFESATVSGKLY